MTELVAGRGDEMDGTARGLGTQRVQQLDPESETPSPLRCHLPPATARGHHHDRRGFGLATRHRGGDVVDPSRHAFHCDHQPCLRRPLTGTDEAGSGLARQLQDRVTVGLEIAVGIDQCVTGRKPGRTRNVRRQIELSPAPRVAARLQLRAPDRRASVQRWCRPRCRFGGSPGRRTRGSLAQDARISTPRSGPIDSRSRPEMERSIPARQPTATPIRWAVAGLQAKMVRHYSRGE